MGRCQLKILLVSLTSAFLTFFVPILIHCRLVLRILTNQELTVDQQSEQVQDFYTVSKKYMPEVYLEPC